MKKNLKWRILCGILMLLIGVFFLYTGNYSHSEASVKDSLVSDEQVQVTRTDYGWYFDGPSEEYALVYYPGAKVETIAYAAFLRRLAQRGMDACLVEMPFHLAIFGMNKAASVMEQYSYEHWYMGGHSLGGAMAANYAAKHSDGVEGIILFAAYPTRKLSDGMKELLIYGSEDHVLRVEKVTEGRKYAPQDYVEHIIEGGNHAQFGNYGRQKGDGTATISSYAQQEEAVSVIVDEIMIAKE